MTDLYSEPDRVRAALEKQRLPLDAARDRIAGLEEKVAQLETALQSRIVIEQAKGMLAERLSVGVDEAFDILRYAARSHRLKLHDLARSVIEDEHTPAPVVMAVARSRRATARA
jgi:AmiR/NasT family two-component response regulator